MKVNGKDNVISLTFFIFSPLDFAFSNNFRITRIFFFAVSATASGALLLQEGIMTDSVRKSKPDYGFDAVLSNLCIHNIPTKEGREKACRETARVLKPNGTAIITDKSPAKEYGETFAVEGLAVEFFRSSRDGSFRRIVKAVKK